METDYLKVSSSLGMRPFLICVVSVDSHIPCAVPRDIQMRTHLEAEFPPERSEIYTNIVSIPDKLTQWEPFPEA